MKKKVFAALRTTSLRRDYALLLAGSGTMAPFEKLGIVGY
jgi:hypothetical protein